MYALTIQCAWCRKLKGPNGQPTGDPLPMSAAPSHGVCTECKARVLAEYDGTALIDGSTDRALSVARS